MRPARTGTREDVASAGEDAHTTPPRVKALTVYPLKSAGGIPVQRMRLDSLGAAGDRRWLLVDHDGAALTAREHRAIMSIRPAFRDGRMPAQGLILRRDGMSEIVVGAPATGERREAIVWGDVVPAIDCGDAAAEWCTKAIGIPARLVHIDPDAHRPVAARFGGPVPTAGRDVSFTDGAPLSVLGTASVDALNTRLVEAGEARVGFERFRPNILLETRAAHAEDTWAEIGIGDAVIGIGSQCARCVMTTIDPASDVSSREPLRTLGRYRRLDGAVVFAMNATHWAPGSFALGDEVRVLSHASRPTVG